MAQTYTLYGSRRSSSFTIEALLAEAGAPYTLTYIDLDKSEQRQPDYLRVNPLGRIPALVLPDGQVITESAAIILTVAERHPEAGLLPPPGTSERATIYRWLMFIACNIYEAVGRWDYPERYTNDAAGAGGIKTAAKEELRRLWRIVETHLAPAPYALGERFTALDAYIANLIQWIVGQHWLDAHCPRLVGIAANVRSRPAIGPVWDRHFGGVSP